MNAARTVSLFSLGLVLGCFGDSEVGSIHVLSADVVAATGGTLEVTSEMHAELAGTRIEIPPGALSADTRITIGTKASIVPAAAAVAPAVYFGPAGVVFSTPAILRIPAGSTDLGMAFSVYSEDTNGAVRLVSPGLVAADKTQNMVEFETSQAMVYQTGPAGLVPPTDPLCGDPAQCGTKPLFQALCWDGSTSEATDNCLDNADGTCSWEIRGCPVEPTGPIVCSDPSLCGTKPLFQALCWDGSTSEATDRCLDNGDTTCSWEIRECPPCNSPPCQDGTLTDPDGDGCFDTCSPN